MESENSPFFFITTIGVIMPLAFARSVLTGGNSKSITISRSAASVNEGSSVTFTLNTSGFAGESIGYNITGISSADLSSGSLNGNITINENETGSVTLTTSADSLTEGTENMTFNLNSDFQSFAPDGSTSTVQINDTSLTPSVSAVTRGASSVDEGSTVTMSVTTSNLGNAKRIYYKITGVQSADITNVTTGSPSTGTVTFNSGSMTSEAGYITTNSSGTGNCTISINADEATEGNQTFTFTVTRLANGSGTTLRTDGSSGASVQINDTSVTHPTGQYVWGDNPAQNYSNTNAGFTDYNYTLPSNVTDFSVVAVGGGGGGNDTNQAAYGAGGGGGGATTWASWTGAQSGTVFELRVGKGGNRTANGGQSFWRKQTNYAGSLYANGGQAASGQGPTGNSNNLMPGGAANNNFGSNPPGSSRTQGNSNRGGSGGPGYYVYNNANNVGSWGGGGGGAGGWNGAGGHGGQNGGAGDTGITGGGGGGSSLKSPGNGGGVGLDGSGANGAGGSGTSYQTNNASNGGDGSPWSNYEYGGGGKGAGTRANNNYFQTTNRIGERGKGGAVRIKYSKQSQW